jgi:hypothetical protein
LVNSCEDIKVSEITSIPQRCYPGEPRTAGNDQIAQISGEFRRLYPKPVPMSNPSLFPANSGARKWWSYMAVVSGTIPECESNCFYGAKIRSVSCRLRNLDLIIKFNIGIPISYFDFVSSHTDPKGYKLVSWFISISDGFLSVLPVEIAFFSQWKIHTTHCKYFETEENMKDYSNSTEAHTMY